MKLNDLVFAAHATARQKGWHDSPRSFGEEIALVHSELSEALEDYRNGCAPDAMTYKPDGKPEGIPSELADVLIRIFDMCGRYNIDIGKAVMEKMAYNATRPTRHGGKRI